MPWLPPRHKPAGQRTKAEADKARPSAAKRGYDARWRKARLAYLAANPLCTHCKTQGIITAATVVDHITPHKGDERLFWDVANWSACCKPCHDRKTALEDGRWG
jgi:5-methylcytosine-specific restriction protein A